MRKKYLKMPNKKIKAVEKNMVIVKLILPCGTPSREQYSKSKDIQ